MRPASFHYGDMSVIENIWPSATTLRSKQPEHPRELPRWETKLPFIVCTSWSNSNAGYMPQWNAPLFLPSNCVRSTAGSAETADVASLFYYWCFQTSAAARVARLRPISDVQPTPLLHEIQLSFVLRDWQQHLLACVIGDVESTRWPALMIRGEGRLIPRTRIALDRKLIFTSEHRNCRFQWRPFRRCLFWITLT